MQLVFLRFQPIEETVHTDESVVAFSDGALLRLFKLGERHIHRDAFAPRELLQFSAPPIELRFGEWLNRTIGQRQFAVRDDQIPIQPDGVAEALARRTRAERIIEAEQVRFGPDVTQAAMLALEPLGEGQAPRLITDGLNDGLPVAFLIAGFERVNQPVAHLGLHAQPIHERVDTVEALAGEAVRRLQLDKFITCRIVEPREAALHQTHQMRFDIDRITSR